MGKKEKLNIVWGFSGRFFLIILGFVVPRLMIKGYGSDLNGLLSTVSQIFTYLALLEAGIGQAARNALYGPFSENNKSKISEISSAAQKYYRKITLLYVIIVVGLSFILPFVVKSNISKPTTTLIVLFQGMANVITFYYVQTKTVVLQVDGRGYVVQAATVINRTMSYLAQIVLALFGFNILILQIVYFGISLLMALFYKGYFDRKYQWLKFDVKSDGFKLPDRNSYVLTEIAWTIFSSTDMIVLSVFISTQLSSVYSVYSMIFTQLAALLSSVYQNFHYVLGQTYHNDIEKYEKIHDLFTSLCLGTMTVFMSVTYLLIIPFVKLYTSGVNDINYIYPSLPLMFCLVQMLSWSRMVSGHLTGVAGYAKQVSVISLLEACINIVLSITLVHKMGITGVLLATVIALPLKVVYCTYLCDKKILMRSYSKSLKIFFANYSVFAIAVLLDRFFAIKIENYLSFIMYGTVFLVAFIIICGSLNYVLNPNLRFFIKRKIGHG